MLPQPESHCKSPDLYLSVRKMEAQERQSSDESSFTSLTTLSVESPPPEKTASPMLSLEQDLAELYSENVIAKIWRVASAHGKVKTFPMHKCPGCLCKLPGSDAFLPMAFSRLIFEGPTDPVSPHCSPDW
jgi:hypothetical protein